MTFRYRWNPGGPLSPHVVQRIAARVMRLTLSPLCPGQSEWVLQRRVLSPRRRLHPRTR